MLIDKGITPGEVVTIKLTSGEEIISKLVDDGPMFYKLSKPMVLSAGPQGMGLIPYLITVNPDKEIKMFKSSVITIEATDKQFADVYVQQTTGIKLA